MIKKDLTAHFIKSYKVYGCNTPQKELSGYYFSAKKAGCNYTIEEYQNILVKQKELPVEVYYNSYKNIRWWMFQDEFFIENEGFTDLEVKALIVEKEEKKRKRINRAVASLNTSQTLSSNELKNDRIIPSHVKVFIWQRDKGRCVKCGSQERLEYDHIIPISKGGSNTERNIQLLCERCNRSKGGNIE